MKEVEEYFVPLKILKLVKVEDVSFVFLQTEWVGVSLYRPWNHHGSIFVVNSFTDELVQTDVMRSSPHYRKLAAQTLHAVQILLGSVVYIELLEHLVDLLPLHALLLFTCKGLDLSGLCKCPFKPTGLVGDLVEGFKLELGKHFVFVLLEEKACKSMVKFDLVQFVLG